MKRVVLAGVVSCLLLLAGCGGKSSSTSTAVTVAVSPATASVITGQTQQFTATVTNTTNTAVNWTVNGIGGGNQTVGFVSSTGLYTAPNSVPTPATVTVAAVSQADTTKSASATVAITAAATPTSSLVVSPQSATVPAGSQVTFTATVGGNPIAVNWALHCGSTAAGACGTITSGGVYTAPASPPPGANVTVTATAQDNSVPGSGAVVTVQFGTGTLNGQYAFTLSGQQSGGTAYVAAGSITFDGSGHVTGGTMTVGGSTTAVTISSGTYHIGTDGRGNAALTTSAGASTWQFAVVNHGRAFVELFNSGLPAASGTMDLQDPTQFAASSINGSYAFNLSGANGSGKPGSLAEAGAFTADGTSGITGLVQDTNDAGTATSASGGSGSFGAPTAGSGTLSLGSTNFQYFIVDATHLKIVGTNAQLVGEVYKQPAGPFSAGSLRGGFAFALLGSASGSGTLGEGGVFTLDGNGHATSGTIDTNDNGSPRAPVTVSGTYSVTDATTGRTTLTIASLSYVLYPQINGALSMVETDANVVAGRVLAQSPTGFSTGSLLGNYGFYFSGAEFTASIGEEDIVGQMLPNGGGAIGGAVAINDNGALTTSATLTTVAPGYSISANGRGTAGLSAGVTAFSNATFNVYIVDANTALFLEMDGRGAMAGMAQKQY